VKSLFDEVAVGKLVLPNRLVMAPMTRSRATSTGLVSPLTARYYVQRASAGLIVSEGIWPSAIGQGSIDTPGLVTSEQVAAWRQVTDDVHEAGGRIFAQLWHSGRVAHQSLYPAGGWPVAPSPVACPGRMVGHGGQQLDYPVPRALSLGEIAGTIADFAIAARNAIDAGFDGVEIHGANGYLIHQFLADNTNLRTDRYGGSDAGRIRFAVEVTEAVADAVGPERTALRLSPGNPYQGIEEPDPTGRYLDLIRALPPELAYIHVLEVANRPVAEALRAAWPGVLMLNPHSGAIAPFAGMHASVEAAHDALGVADLVSLGGLWLANPDLPRRIRTGGPYQEPDHATFYGGDHRGYTDYPTLTADPAPTAGEAAA
jgi:N-ethylmaleimide reductase